MAPSLLAMRLHVCGHHFIYCMSFVPVSQGNSINKYGRTTHLGARVCGRTNLCTYMTWLWICIFTMMKTPIQWRIYRYIFKTLIMSNSVICEWIWLRLKLPVINFSRSTNLVSTIFLCVLSFYNIEIRKLRGESDPPGGEQRIFKGDIWDFMEQYS